jgi:hypothetical protein
MRLVRFWSDLSSFGGLHGLVADDLGAMGLTITLIFWSPCLYFRIII